ncbi:SAV_2336 N-terminal domain-related protein, partial [Streptomyces sp.]|uniref:SAV_2336 N-terminal domain-related protein n=1 Tax=Streptomyces sp. TaxID=1931 RepID=UPI002F40F9C5
VGLFPLGAGRTEGGVAAYVVRVTQPAALTGALDLARALRPLRQTVDSPGPALLDEEATAQATAEAGRTIPVSRPAAERRFSVDLLVDTGATMAVWHRLAAELCTLLERHGAFAAVRCWSLDTDGPVPRLAPFRRRHGGGERTDRDGRPPRVPPAPSRPAHPPGHALSRPAQSTRWWGPLEDPTRRAVLLVLTDGVGPAWYGAELPEYLARVAGERPAAALQVLPRRLWHRTALRTVPVELRVADPARPVAEVRTTAALPGPPRGERLPGVRWLPVMEVDGSWLAPWAGLVAGRVPGWTPMLAAPVRGVSRPRRVPATTPPPAGPADRVARFRAGSSPDAFRLACHLAAAPLSLPVMRLVQQATMPRSGPTDLAQLFLSGLIGRRGELRPDPDEVVYDFAPGVRDELLAELTRTESLHVLEDVLAKVSGRVAATFGGTLDFRALAALAEGGAVSAVDGDGAGTGSRRLLPEASLPFAEVAVAVLSGAGGQHTSLAARLAAAAEGRSWAPGEGEREGTRSPDEPRAVPHPEFLRPVPAVVSPPDPETMIGRATELAELEQALRPAARRRGDWRQATPSVVLIDCRPRMSGNRLVQEYVRRYGGRHSFIHWIDASDDDSLDEGLRALGAALGSPSDFIEDIWDTLQVREDWLLVLDRLPADRGIGINVPHVPRFGRGGVIVTSAGLHTHRLLKRRITLGPLTRAEIAEYLTAVLGPRLPQGDEEARRRVLRLAETLPTDPAELALLDVGALFAADTPDPATDPPPLPPHEPATGVAPRPLHEWTAVKGDRGLAGFVRGGSVWLAAAGYGSPVRLWGSAEGAAKGSAISDAAGAVQTLAVFPDATGRPVLAVVGVGGAVVIRELPSGARQYSFQPYGVLAADLVTAFVRADGRRILVTARRDSAVRFWDATTGDAVDSPLTEHVSRVRALTVVTARDGRRLAVIVHEKDRSAEVRDTVTGEQVVSPLPAGLAGVEALATVRVQGRPDLIAAIRRDAVVELWDTATGGLAARLDTRARWHLVAVASFDGPHGEPLLATASAEGRAQVWDLRSVLPPPPARGPAGLSAGEYARWLVHLLDTGEGVPPDVLDLLLSGEGSLVEWPPGEGWRRLVEKRLLTERSSHTVRLASAERFRLLDAEAMDAQRADAVASDLFDAVRRLCAEPTADPDTWRPYEVLRPVLPVLTQRMMDWPRTGAAGPGHTVSALTFVARCGRFHLLHGDPVEADRLVEMVEASVGPDDHSPGRDRREADAVRTELDVVSLRARSAVGRVAAAHERCRAVLSVRPFAPQAVEALLSGAELALWEGDFQVAEEMLADAAALAEPDAGSTRSVRRSRARYDIVTGRLGDAARELRSDSARRKRPAPAAPGDIDAETAELLAMGRRRHLRGSLNAVTDDLAADRERAGTLPEVWGVWLEMWSPPGGARSGVPNLVGMEPTFAAQEGGREGVRDSFQALAAVVPTEYLDLQVALTELVAEGAVRYATGVLWGPAPQHMMSGSTLRNIAEAENLINGMGELGTRLRHRRPHLYARLRTAEGRVLLAGGYRDAARAALTAATEVTTRVFGARSPLLPRLELLTACAHHLDGRTREAEQHVSAAESLLDDLYGRGPHQDRVTALRARSRLAVTPAAREDAGARAEAMATRLLRDVEGTRTDA